MVIFHSYVSLPEGNLLLQLINKEFGHCPVKPPALLLCHPVQGASERSARWAAMVKLYWIDVVWSSIVHPKVGILVMDTLLLSDIDVDIP